MAHLRIHATWLLELLLLLLLEMLEMTRMHHHLRLHLVLSHLIHRHGVLDVLVLLAGVKHRSRSLSLILLLPMVGL
jgi:hypothetical protein